MVHHDSIEVCMAIYQRWESFPDIIQRFKNQSNQNFRLHIWNNSGHHLDPGDFPSERIFIIDSAMNLGSKARFYLIKKTTGSPIIFLDDDEEIKNDFIAYMYATWIEQGKTSVLGSFGKIFSKESYWDSWLNPPPNTEVDYIATKAMILDRKIFELEPELLDLPDYYDGVEDLYLSAVARKHGWRLVMVQKRSRSIDDGKDQYLNLHDQKERVFSRLRMSGWKLLSDEKKKAPKISVVIPCFNYGQYLLEAIQSVLSQSFQDFEIIVVDDGSTDELTKKIISEIHHPQVRVIHEGNKGESSARNHGIREARGEFIVPLDADDRLAPTFLEKTYWLIQKNPKAGFIYTGVELFGDREGVFVECFYEYNFARLLENNFIHPSSLFRKKDWELIGGYNEQINEAEDWEFWLNMGEHGIYGQFLPEPLVYYRQHNRSQSATRTQEAKEHIVPRLRSLHEKLFEPKNMERIDREWKERQNIESVVISPMNIQGVAFFIRALEEKVRVIQRENDVFLRSIYQSRGWRFVSFIHRIRKKIPFLRNL